MRDKLLIPQPGIFKSCNTIYNNLHLVSILWISSCTSLHHILKGIPIIIFYLAASMPRVFSTSKVLLDVVWVPFTPAVAITFLRLSPSTKSLYLVAPLFSSMWITARDTDGTPWNRTSLSLYQYFSRTSYHFMTTHWCSNEQEIKQKN